MIYNKSVNVQNTDNSMLRLMLLHVFLDYL